MTQYFNITHEDGTLSDYDTTTTDGGDLSAETAAAMAGTNYGLQYVIDDNTAIEVQKEFTHTTTKLNWRFYFDPNGLTMADADAFALGAIVQAGSTAKCIIWIKYTAAGGYFVSFGYREDDQTWHYASDYALTDDPHFFEMRMVKASADDQADATCDCYVDDIRIETISGVDLFDDFYDKGDGSCYTRIRAAAVDTGTRGTFFADNQVANNDGTPIGPRGGPDRLGGAGRRGENARAGDSDRSGASAR